MEIGKDSEPQTASSASIIITPGRAAGRRGVAAMPMHRLAKRRRVRPVGKPYTFFLRASPNAADHAHGEEWSRRKSLHFLSSRVASSFRQAGRTATSL